MAEGHVILEKDMSSVIDSSNSVNTPLLKNRSDRSTSQSCWKDHCCFSKEADFELTENFPCWFKPLQYFLLDRFPFIQWLRRYRPRTFVSDLIAGLTVGLMVVPQALAYASIAGLPLEYGLYSSFMGVIVYTFFGTSKDITLGPTAILSLLTASLINSGANPDNPHANVPLAVLLTLLSGVVQFVMGILNLGFLIDFIPLPVISGFTSAAAITIAMGQVKHLFGIKKTVRRPFIQAVYDTARYLPDWMPWDFALGMFCILLVLFLKYFKTHNENYEKKHPDMHVVPKIAHRFLWIICTGRNAVVVIVAGLIGFAIKSYCGDVKDGDLPFTPVNYTAEGNLPTLHIPSVTIDNIKKIGVGIVVAPLIGFLESIAIAKSFGRQNQYMINPTQELIALGLSNVASCFVGSYPITGSFSRTAVNSQSGVKTPAAGLFTGAVVLLALGVLSQLFDFIPKTALAAIIIAAVLYMVDVKILHEIWKVKKLDDLPLVVSFLGTLLLGIEYGVPIASVLCILILLYRHSRTRHKVQLHGNMMHLTFNGGWTYPGVEYIWKRVRQELEGSKRNVENGQAVKAVVFDCTSMPEVDYSIIQGLREGCKELSNSSILVILVAVQPHVQQTIEKAKVENLKFTPSLSIARQMVEENELMDEKLITSVQYN